MTSGFVHLASAQNPGQQKPNIVVFYRNHNAAIPMEYYNLQTDPFQVTNTATLLGSRTARLQNMVNALTTCFGANCQTIENSAQP